MTTFADKPSFSLKQLVAAVTIAAGIGAGIARFESKMNNIDMKLNTMIALMDTSKKVNTFRFEVIDKRLLASEENIRAITSSLTAIMVRPEDVEITKQR